MMRRRSRQRLVRAEVLLHGDRIRIRELLPQDMEAITGWTTFEDPLLAGYNYGNLSKTDRENWYIDKALKPQNRYFAVTLKNGRFIGYIGVKKIRWRLGTSLLGIVMDPAHIDQGFGQEALGLFLDLYFKRWKMRKLDLEVNDFNIRAIRLYKRYGFKRVQTYHGLFENQDIPKDLLVKRSLAASFVYRFGKLYSINHRMRLERGRYLNETQS